MKALFFISFFFISIYNANGQDAEPGGCDCCFIRYTYDLAGNRIKRDFYCEPRDLPYRVAYSQIDSNTVEDQSWIIYPNPNDGKFEIRFSEKPDNFSLHILDAEGKIVFQSVANNIVEYVDVSYLAPGSYFITINDKKKNTSKKIIKVD